jgi:hypothetical protein
MSFKTEIFVHLGLCSESLAYDLNSKFLCFICKMSSSSFLFVISMRSLAHLSSHMCERLVSWKVLMCFRINIIRVAMNNEFMMMKSRETHSNETHWWCEKFMLRNVICDCDDIVFSWKENVRKSWRLFLIYPNSVFVIANVRWRSRSICGRIHHEH